MNDIIFSYVFPIVVIFLSLIQIFTCILLFKSRSRGRWLMLWGTLVSSIFSLLPYLNPIAESLGTGIFQFDVMLVWLIAALGSIVFGMGFLIHALNFQASERRVKELENILATKPENSELP